MTISTAIYDENRRFLWSVCYRMTGNAADAEEIVQETFIRALEKPPPDTKQAWLPWLTRVAVNLSRDFLRHRRKTEYVGEWLPSPIPTEILEIKSEESPAGRYDLRESISVAFLLALEALTPGQRAVLLLRDVFDYSTIETANLLEMTETNIKVLLHRARRAMRDYDKSRTPTDAAHQEKAQKTLQKFLQCLERNDVEGLEKLLTENVVVVSDGGGEVTALLKPMSGREKVLRLITQLYEVYRSITKTSVCVLNNQPALLVERPGIKPGHAARYTLQCEYDETGRIKRFNFVFAPSKLAALKD
jgi:RNA polymerase sigma-70 factor, ECF subfamily